VSNKKIPSFDNFEKAWWKKHKKLANSELGSNGQFDELPYVEYYGKDAFGKTKRIREGLKCQ
jgi:hypothetical protein